jgi:hypothetical protein
MNKPCALIIDIELASVYDGHIEFKEKGQAACTRTTHTIRVVQQREELLFIMPLSTTFTPD